MNDSLWRFALVALTTVFTVVDPVGIAPPFLATTRHLTEPKRREVALRAVLVAGGVLVVFATAGQLVFQVFGITLDAFRIAGGLLLFLVALDMVRGARAPAQSTPDAEGAHREHEDVAVIPLAIPLVSGPGAIASVVMLSGRASSIAERGVVYGAILITCAATWLVMRSAPRLARALGPTGTSVLTRIMGLMLAALAVQFVIDGVRAVVAGT
jgi:multiple antibiotic resistance protein